MPSQRERFIVFSPEDRELRFAPGETVLEVAEAYHLDLAHSCGGMGSCGTCRIIVESSSAPLPEKEGLELEMAENRGFKENERLACQVLAVPGLRFRTPED